MDIFNDIIPEEKQHQNYKQMLNFQTQCNSSFALDMRIHADYRK